MTVVPLLGLLGCALAGGGGVVWQDPEVNQVWPPPPAEERVRLLRTLSGADDFRRTDRASRVYRWLTGDQGIGLSLVSPYGVTADGEGRVWVSDGGLAQVLLFDLNRQRVEQISEAGKQSLVLPLGVAYDVARDRLFVSDGELRAVFQFTGEGKFLSYFAPQEGFGRPAGLAVDQQGNLYAVDVAKGRVEVFSPEGQHQKSLGLEEAAGGPLNRPTNVAVDKVGRVFVSDGMNFRVVVFDPDGKLAAVIGRLGDAPGSFSRLRGVAVDSDGHLYASDAAFDNIQVFDLAGRLLLFFGGPGATPGRFSLPAGLHFDSSDRLYAVDALNRRVQIFQYLKGG